MARGNAWPTGRLRARSGRHTLETQAQSVWRRRRAPLASCPLSSRRAYRTPWSRSTRAGRPDPWTRSNHWHHRQRPQRLARPLLYTVGMTPPRPAHRWPLRPLLRFTLLVSRLGGDLSRILRRRWRTSQRWPLRRRSGRLLVRQLLQGRTVGVILILATHPPCSPTHIRPQLLAVPHNHHL
jgi:hypothetical protein